VEELQIGMATGKSMAGAGDAQTGRIL